MARRNVHQDHYHGEHGDGDWDAHGLKVPGPLPEMTVYARGTRASYLDPLQDPKWFPAAEATWMRPDDFVLGLPLEQNSYAMPWWVMKNHHIANLELEGKPFAITLCENCSSACAYDPVVNGLRLTFATAGKYAGTILMEDLQTDTYWAPFTGEALHGELAGTILEPYPLYQCTWQEWLELYPHTLVVSGEGESRTGHGANVLPGTLEKKFVKSIARDKRLRPNVLVLGVTIEGGGRAYPLEALALHNSVVNDDVKGRPIVVFSRPNSLLAMAFSRLVDGRELIFERAGPLLFRDTETGSEWNFEGLAVNGPLEGSRLGYVPCAIEEWYAYAAARKDVDVFELESVRAGWGQTV